MKNSLRSKSILFIVLVLILSLLLFSAGCKGRNTSEPAAPSPTISVSSQQIDNGAVVLDSVLDQTVTIQNTGSFYLNIGQIAQAKPLTQPFSIVDDKCSGKALSGSGSCSFQVRFSPLSEGSFTDNFDIPSNATNEGSVMVNVSGRGRALRVTINQPITDQCGGGILALLVTVTDKNNIAQTGLSAGDFELSENGEKKEIRNLFPVAAPATISVATLLDYSMSLESQLLSVEAASRIFIDMLNPGDEAAIIKFGLSSQLMQDFTMDKTALSTAIDTPPSLTEIGSRSESHIYDAVWFALQKTSSRTGNRAVVLISDGKDENSSGVPNVSVKTMDEVIAYAIEKNIAIFTIGLGKALNGGVMDGLAKKTGGQYFPYTSGGDLSNIYRAIGNVLAGQYSLEYTSLLHGSSPVLLDLLVTQNGQGGEASRQIQGCP